MTYRIQSGLFPSTPDPTLSRKSVDVVGKISMLERIDVLLREKGEKDSKPVAK